MAIIVCVHGIGQEYEARETLLPTWAAALRGGVSLAGGRCDDSQVEMAFYGHLFRPRGTKSGDGIPDFQAGDIEDPLETELLQEFDDSLVSVAFGDLTKGGHRTIASMLQRLAQTPYFGGAAQKVVIWSLNQVRRYFTEPVVRTNAKNTLCKLIADDTRVVVAHSLGSVVAYETLCEHPEFPVTTLVTLGSPLGLRALLPRLAPPASGVPAAWPGRIERWTNVADATDVVALSKTLATIYGPRVVDCLVHNGATMHDVRPYLTAAETGRAIIAGL